MLSRRVDNMLETATIAAVVLVGVYFIGKKLVAEAPGAINEARKQVGAAIGETLFDWFHPSPGQLVTLTFKFPDGTYGAVNSDEVDANGYFTYWRDGSRWRLAVAQSGNRVAVPA